MKSRFSPKILLYLIASIILGILIVSSFRQQVQTDKTLKQGNRFNTRVIKTDCNSGRLKPRAYFKTLNGEIKHVNLTALHCESLITGDIIAVFELDDWYELDLSSIAK